MDWQNAILPSIRAGRVHSGPMNGEYRPKIVVLTGGIASGKTAVSNLFAELGVPIVDTDVIARELVQPGGEALDEIRREFGNGVIAGQGALDRTALREIIFRDAKARARLEAILHPRIAGEARRRIHNLDAPYVVLVVPLLVESGLFGDADEIVVVDVPEDVQIQRLMTRDGSSREQAEAALAAQASRRDRLARADHVIDNTGTMEQLRARVAQLDRRLRANC